MDKLLGWVNVDKFGEPDVRVDLDNPDWPWETSSVDEVLMKHVLEHLGPTANGFRLLMQELYRVCKNGAKVRILVPHPRHDDFLGDPTHVRPITIDLLTLFAGDQCERWQKMGASNSLLAFYYNVDFRVIEHGYALDEQWAKAHAAGNVSEEDLRYAIKHYNNVVKEIDVTLEVHK